MPYELKPRDVETIFLANSDIYTPIMGVDSKTTEKSFLRRIGDEKWIFYDWIRFDTNGYSTNPKKKKYYAKPGQSLSSTSTSTLRPNIHGSKIIFCISWWDQKALVYYELLKSDFHYGRSISAKIDSFEPCIARKTAGIRAKT